MMNKMMDKKDEAMSQIMNGNPNDQKPLSDYTAGDYGSIKPVIEFGQEGDKVDISAKGTVQKDGSLKIEQCQLEGGESPQEDQGDTSEGDSSDNSSDSAANSALRTIIKGE